MMYRNLSERKVIHISAWGRTFTQFRLPLIRRQNEIFKRVLLYCPNEQAHIKRLEEEGFEIEIASVSKKPDLHIVLQILKLYQYLKRGEFDVLFAHHPMGALIGIPAARIAKVPLKIYSTGGLKYSPDRGGLSNLLVRYGEMQLIKMADAVFLVNREDEKLLKSIPAVREKAYYVGPQAGCGCDTENFNIDKRLWFRGKARRELGVDDETFLVGYAGRCVWEKGFKEIVNAAGDLRENMAGKKILFMILGDGLHLSEIRDYVNRKGLLSLFIFLGYKFNVSYYLSAIDVFVLPSYREGAPVSLLQAMALGIPSIASNTRGSRELINHGESGMLVPIRNAEALKGAILSMKNRHDRGESLGRRGAKHVLGSYSEGALLNKTMELIQSLIEKNCLSSSKP